jgi:cyclophilin family peptidyl-prolyl cis-trans isomerase
MLFLTSMKRLLGSVLAISLLTSIPLAAANKQVLSKVYPIERKYKSMEGPFGAQTVYLGEERDKPELLWLTGIKTEVVGEDGRTLKSPELMCHMNVDIDPAKHKALFHLQRFPAARLMTISQGMRVREGGFAATLPEGFGFPIASNEPLLVMTQVLNHNIEHPKNLKVRHRVTFEYVRDADLRKPLIPLFNLAASGMVEMSNNPLALTSGMQQSTDGLAADHAGASCLVGMRAPNAAGMASDFVSPQGRHMTGHWVVPPGKQVNASDVTWFMNLPYDTKLHYAAVHLHPFAQSLTLRDATTGTDIFKAQAVNPKKGVGLARVDAFVSVEGVPLFKRHKYELISIYDNPTSQNADSMASMFLGLDDPEFVAPTPADLVARASVFVNDGVLVLRTTAGDLGATLMRDQAPKTLVQFARLMNAGAFRGAEASVTPSSITFSAPLTDEIRALLQPPEHEAGIPHRSGAISLCLPAADAKEISFVIVTTSASELDGRCTVLAQVGPGAAVLRAIDASGSARLLRGEILSSSEIGDLQLAPARPVASLR